MSRWMFTAALLALPAVASGEFVPTAQDRSVQASATAADKNQTDSDSSSDMATDFGPFMGNAGVSVSADAAFANMAASQTSEIGFASISGSGSIGGSAESWDYGNYGEASGESRFDVTFDVTSATEFMISGELNEFDNGFTYLDLTGPSGEVFSWFGGGPPFSHTGNLEAGSHRLVVETQAGLYGEGWSDYGSGDYNFLLELPVVSVEPAGPVALELSVWPNPARGVVHIDHAAAGITIYDAAGRHLRELSGGDSVVWDATDAAGRTVAPGVYFVRPNDGGVSSRVLITR